MRKEELVKLKKNPEKYKKYRQHKNQYMKQYNQRPEVKQRMKQYMKQYYQRPEVKQHMKQYMKQKKIDFIRNNFDNYKFLTTNGIDVLNKDWKVIDKKTEGNIRTVVYQNKKCQTKEQVIDISKGVEKWKEK